MKEVSEQLENSGWRVVVKQWAVELVQGHEVGEGDQIAEAMARAWAPSGHDRQYDFSSRLDL